MISIQERYTIILKRIAGTCVYKRIMLPAISLVASVIRFQSSRTPSSSPIKNWNSTFYVILHEEAQQGGRREKQCLPLITSNIIRMDSKLPNTISIKPPAYVRDAITIASYLPAWEEMFFKKLLYIFFLFPPLLHVWERWWSTKKSIIHYFYSQFAVFWNAI